MFLNNTILDVMSLISISGEAGHSSILYLYDIRPIVLVIAHNLRGLKSNALSVRDFRSPAGHVRSAKYEPALILDRLS